jgi:F-type H+/Na+-transporting ATPase subunit alpha
MSLFTNLEAKLNSITDRDNQQSVGTIISVKDGVAMADGLSSVSYNEIVEILVDGKYIPAVAFNLETDKVGLLILSNQVASISAGCKCFATEETLSVEVGDEILGRVVDALGEPIDGLPLSYTNPKLMPIERKGYGVMDRQSVTRPLKTGITVIDSLVNIGRGQRELIIGDRQTGKTTIAIDAILNQKKEKVICVYVSIGQKQSKTRQLIEKLENDGAMEYCVVVSASASDNPAMQYLSAYSGVSIAEYFMEQGKDVLIVYDDLTKQAWAYRQLSLLFRRPPGREAYPGDVFFLHSRLLERACQLNEKLGGGSITALPIIETQAGDISAYIPTNVISITDGQIFMESNLFNSGIRPAVSPGLSVTRVGGAAQTKAMKKVAGSMKLELAQYRELESFSQFGGDLDKGTQLKLLRGKLATQVLVQPPYSPLSQASQIITIFAVNNGFMDKLNINKVSLYCSSIRKFLSDYYPELNSSLNSGKWLDESKDDLTKVCADFENSELIKEFLI